jgi:hypothetical protein
MKRTLTITLLLPLVGAVYWIVKALDEVEPARQETRRIAVSPLNGRGLKPPAEGADYCAFLIGHPYGHFLDRDSTTPARSLLSSIKAINDAAPVFVALLGDNVRKAGEPYAGLLRSRFAAVVDAPVFSLPGEHDLGRGSANYQRLFGPLFYRIELGREIFIVLNTGGGANPEISNSQLEFLKRALEDAEASDTIKNVFLLMHRVVWADLPRYRKLKPFINNVREGSFWSTIYPVVRAIAGSKRVYIGSGDIGHKSYSFFLDRNPEDGITYFATGLADQDSDTIVRIDSSGTGEISVVAVSLTDRPVQISATTLEGFPNWSLTRSAGEPW